uniref:tRNA-dihydrouridine(47) synthase [NAD(P)(+)] n=2 Tax=Oryza TaxID=4527 RepID=A0A0D3FS10_9ORYZ
MAMCTNLLQGQASEWALLRRHSSEDLFGVQICGAYPDTVARTVELVDNECSVDFIDINMGCPIDIVVNKGAGSSLLTKPMRIKSIVQAASTVTEKPLTVKVRTAFFEGRNRADSIVSDIYDWGASAITVHGRSRQQRYSKLADWDYIYQCAQKAPDQLHVVGNGDVFSFTDWNKHVSGCSKISTCMIARGALIKPWIFTEVKEQRHWDITSGERFNILKDFVSFGLEHWGSDSKGVETTRYFLLEWLSYTCRYIPVGLLDVIPQRLNWRPPSYCGRDDLETLMISDSAADWIRISEMLLGKVPEGFTFTPKHKSNAYDRAENG